MHRFLFIEKAASNQMPCRCTTNRRAGHLGLRASPILQPPKTWDEWAETENLKFDATSWALDEFTQQCVVGQDNVNFACGTGHIVFHRFTLLCSE
jgi:hypothetical protein